MSAGMIKWLFLGSVAEANPLEIEEKVQKEECSILDERVIIFHWIDQKVDYQNQFLQENIGSQLSAKNICFVPMETLFQRIPASEEDTKEAQKLVEEIENLLQRKIEAAEQEWIDAVKALKTFSIQKKDISFEAEPKLQERIFEAYVMVGGKGGENTDENLKTLYMSDITGIRDNANYFMYQAALISLDSKNIDFIDKISNVKHQKNVKYYLKKIQEFRDAEANELVKEFYQPEEWAFKPDVNISLQNKSYLIRYELVSKNEPQKNLYIAIAKHGDPHFVSIWKAGENPNSLQIIPQEEEKEGLYFLLTAGTGILSGGTSVATNDGIIAKEHFYIFPDGRGETIDNIGSFAVPLDVNLRAHHGHLMFQAGISFNKKLGGDWVEYIRIPSESSEDIVTVTMKNNCFSRRDSTGGVRDGYVHEENCDVLSEYYQEAGFAQNRYGGIGYVFGADDTAAKGHGLRIGGRIGVLHMPNSLTGTLQTGYTAPIGEPLGNKTQLIIDIDAQAGAMFLNSRNLMLDLEQMERIAPMFGLVFSVGTSL